MESHTQQPRLVGPYVRGELEPGSLHLFRRHEDGALEALASVPGALT